MFVNATFVSRARKHRCSSALSGARYGTRKIVYVARPTVYLKRAKWLWSTVRRSLPGYQRLQPRQSRAQWKFPDRLAGSSELGMSGLRWVEGICSRAAESERRNFFRSQQSETSTAQAAAAKIDFHSDPDPMKAGADNTFR